MLAVTYRNKHWSVPGNIMVCDLIAKLGLNPETVLALKDGKLIHEETMVGDEAEIVLIAVVSGG